VADTRSFASVGKLLGSGARAAMLHLLMDGTHHTARELANHAGVAPSTASAHLSALVQAASSPSSAKVGGVTFSYRPGGSGRLGIVERPGRCARSCLFSSAGNDPTQLATARTCYDHLVGELGVEIADPMMKRGALLWKDGTSIIPEDDAKLIRRLGIGLDGVRRIKRPLVLACSDRTEGRPHVAGALGQALCELFLASGWIRRRPGDSSTLDHGLRCHLAA